MLRDLDEGRLTTEAARQLLALSRRQLFRVLQAYRADGAAGLISRKRGRPSNRKSPDSLRRSALAIVRERYADFGPTFAAEKLAALHEIEISHETLRKWMIADGLWLDRQRRLKRAYQPRYRRDCVGELVQVDGSEHRWFEDRGPMCTLLVFIDDATSRLMQLRFAPSESTFSYFAATRTYLETYGKPVASLHRQARRFQGQPAGRRRRRRPDPISGACSISLNIDLICANSSQAKGRVERANKTLQDRLVKELRLASVSTMEDGNAFLPRFMADYNARFAKPPANLKDLHRPLTARDNLDEALCWREMRHVSQSLTVHYDRTAYILEQTPLSLAAAGKELEVIEFADGPVILRFQGVDLPYRMFDKERRVDQAAIVDNKRLGPLLQLIQAEQLKRDAGKKPRRSGRPVRELRAG